MEEYTILKDITDKKCYSFPAKLSFIYDGETQEFPPIIKFTLTRTAMKAMLKGVILQKENTKEHKTFCL